MTKQKADTPAFEVSPCTTLTPLSGDDTLRVLMPRGSRLRVRGFSPDTQLDLELTATTVALTVSTPGVALDRPEPPEAVAAVSTRPSTTERPPASKGVRIRLWVPYSLRGRFRNAAKRAGKRPTQLLSQLMEEFAATGDKAR